MAMILDTRKMAPVMEADVMAPSRIDGKMVPMHVTLGETGSMLVVMHGGQEYIRYEYADQDVEYSLADRFVRIGGEWVYCNSENIVRRLERRLDGTWKEI